MQAPSYGESLILTIGQNDLPGCGRIAFTIYWARRVSISE